MYTGYTETTEQERARWETMQAVAERRAQAQQAGKNQPAIDRNAAQEEI